MIAVIDYGMGNLHSIAKALEEVGGNVEITNDHEKIKNAERLVLPGVGAFGDGMKNLQEMGLIEILNEEVRKKQKPFLGICLGMQLVASRSEEFGDHQGLNWIDAEVIRFQFPESAKEASPSGGDPKVPEETKLYVGVGDLKAEPHFKQYAFTAGEEKLRVPHVGWNTTRFLSDHPLRQGIKDETDFYFVHSYHIIPKEKDMICGICDYGGDFVSVIAFENIFATQFHPEKSQKEGLKILENFLVWNPSSSHA
jgi:glutamine amidotransferase